MTFLETFGGVFTATITGQVIVWWFKKEIEHRIDKHYEKVKKIFRGENVKSATFRIEKSNNGKYIVDQIIKPASLMNKAEVETNIFDNTNELATYLNTKLN